MSEIIIRLKKEREKLKISQKELAEILEVSAGSVSRWESGEEPSILSKINIVRNFLFEDKETWAKRLLKKKISSL